jgi:hypothetical protein
MVAAAAKDLLCVMMMKTPLVMPFVQGVLFGMHLVNSQETQVACRQEHPCFEGQPHQGRNCSGDDCGGSGRRFALRDDDDKNATGDALCSGCPVWHAPGELARDSRSMSLGTSMLRGSHCGSNHTGDDCGIGGHGGDWHQRSWMTQQLLSAPLRTSPPFISKQKELGGYNATGDALHLGCPVQHAPGELTRDSGSMSLGTSLLQGSHLGSNHTGDDEGSCQRSALPDKDHDEDATDDALRSGHPVQYAPGELARDSGRLSLGTSLLQGSHLGSNRTGDDEGVCIGDCHQGSLTRFA